MKIQIVPDIHNKWYIAEEIIDKEKADSIVFLGDYFDDLSDTLESTTQTAEWLKESLKKSNRTHLLGNHDLSYLDPNHRCSGFSEAKLFAIDLTKLDLVKLQHYCWIDDNWLCTHAGLSNDFYSAYNTKGFEVYAFLDDMIENNKQRLYNVSSYRGGMDSHSGIVWCDYDEFVDIPNVKQIFGHTHGKVRQTENHICIDTWLQYYGLYDTETKTMKVKKVA